MFHGDAGVYRILKDEDIAGAQNFGFLVDSTKAGLIEEPHTHEVEECSYMLKGEGRFAGKAGGHDVGSGIAMYSYIGVRHRLDTVGSENLTYVAVYSPRGPEKELKE